MQTGTKQVIETILRDVELREAPVVNGMVPAKVLRKAFPYPEEIPRIVRRINKDASAQILRVFSENEVGTNGLASLMLRKNKQSLLNRFADFDLGEEMLGESFFFAVDNIDRLKQLAQPLDIPKRQGGDEYFVTRDERGNYYYEGVLMDITNKEALYFILFDVLYESASTGGTVPYQTIEAALRERGTKGGRIRPLSGSEANARIRLNLTSNTNGFLRYAWKNKWIQRTTTTGKPLIQIKRAYGVIFNNSK